MARPADVSRREEVKKLFTALAGHTSRVAVAGMAEMGVVGGSSRTTCPTHSRYPFTTAGSTVGILAGPFAKPEVVAAGATASCLPLHA